MQRIKVCHIITKLELGGAQQNTLYTLSHLDPGKFKPILICGTGGMLDDQASGLANVKVYFVRELLRSIHPLYDATALWKIFRILLKEQPHVVHTHSSKAGVIGRWAAWFAGIQAIVHTFHGFGFNDFQTPPVRALFVFLERLSAGITHRLIAVTGEDIQKGLTHGIGAKERYCVIRSGIDLALYRNVAVDRALELINLGLQVSDSIITTIGPFKPQKNLADFLKVAREVLREEPKCRFLVIGDGEQRPMLEALIKKLQLNDKVTLLGWRTDIPEMLAISDIFVLTSLWEGLPRSILEAMASSLPVVANAVDGVREIVSDGKTGFLVEPFNVKKSSQLIIKLLREKGLAKRMGQQGRAMLDEQYDINVMVRQQERLYNELFYERPGGDL